MSYDFSKIKVGRLVGTAFYNTVRTCLYHIAHETETTAFYVSDEKKLRGKTKIEDCHKLDRDIFLKYVADERYTIVPVGTRERQIGAMCLKKEIKACKEIKFSNQLNSNKDENLQRENVSCYAANTAKLGSGNPCKRKGFGSSIAVKGRLDCYKATVVKSAGFTGQIKICLSTQLGCHYKGGGKRRLITKRP